MSSRIRVRGIYSTALTRLLLVGGYQVVEPSSRILERFGLENIPGPWDISVMDRDDLQGIDLCGQPEKLCQFLTFLQERLVDATLLEFGPSEEDDNLVRARVEFPGATKGVLDELRGTVVPTLKRHHRLRIAEVKGLGAAEDILAENPGERESIETELFREAVLLPLEKSGAVRLEHIRPSGRPMRPREGKILRVDADRILFIRQFSEGRYDGLNVPIQPGDYGLTEVQEEAWVVKHSYHRKDGSLIGEYFNINTPVELYPYGARYVDLEIDVIHRAGEDAFAIDQEKLTLLVREGCIGENLACKAQEVARNLIESLS